MPLPGGVAQRVDLRPNQLLQAGHRFLACRQTVERSRQFGGVLLHKTKFDRPSGGNPEPLEEPMDASIGQEPRESDTPVLGCPQRTRLKAVPADDRALCVVNTELFEFPVEFLNVVNRDEPLVVLALPNPDQVRRNTGLSADLKRDINNYRRPASMDGYALCQCTLAARGSIPSLPPCSSSSKARLTMSSSSRP